MVDCNASNWLVRAIVDFVKSKGRLASINDELTRLRLELPGNFVLCISHEAHTPLAKDIHFFGVGTVVLRMLTHREAKSLANDVVEGHSEEVTTKKEQTHAVDSVKLAPLGLLFEYFVDLDGLTPFSHLNRE